MSTLFKSLFFISFILTVTATPGFTAGKAKGFATILYTGNGSNQQIRSVGFKPDLVWIKDRGNIRYQPVVDSVRGANNVIYTNDTNAQVTLGNHILSFDDNGFSVGDGAAVNNADGSYVAWCWKADQIGVTNAIQTEKYSIDSGLSIIKYDGSSSPRILQHSLGTKPKMIMAKRLSVNSHWYIFTENTGSANALFLNLENAVQGNTVWNNAEPTDSQITTTLSANECIAYIFSEVPGVSSFGSYVGDGIGTNLSIYCGFQPGYVVIKREDANGNWLVFDNKRNPSNPARNLLYANSNIAEFDSTASPIYFTATGFKITGTAHSYNASGGNYVYMAFADFDYDHSGIFAVDGKIGVGVMNPANELEVKGTIMSQKVIVTTDPQEWPDYVFHKDYRLRSLKELNSYIQTNKHLPGIPTAEQLSETGLSVSDILKLQMEKIEELTLYIIEQDRRIRELEDE